MAELRIGMIGLDTSHCIAFAKILNDAENPHHVPGARLVAAVPGGSAAFSLSRDRVEGYTNQLADDFGVQMVESITALAADVDAILLESSDGRQHVEQFAQLAEAGKPVFIDKPFTCSADDARKIADLAAAKDVPVMSCSSIRYAAGISDLRDKGEVLTCEAFGPANILDDYPGLFWYGIHSAEVLFSFMGAGCRCVHAGTGPNMDLVVGQWSDGRIGTLRGFRHDALKKFGCTIATDQGVFHAMAQSDPPYYALMLREVMAFFRSRKSPIDIAETIEITAFLEAANASKAQAGRPVELSI